MVSLGADTDTLYGFVPVVVDLVVRERRVAVRFHSGNESDLPIIERTFSRSIPLSSAWVKI
jgi:hypothetical protein